MDLKDCTRLSFPWQHTEHTKTTAVDFSETCIGIFSNAQTRPWEYSDVNLFSLPFENRIPLEKQAPSSWIKLRLKAAENKEGREGGERGEAWQRQQTVREWMTSLQAEREGTWREKRGKAHGGKWAKDKETQGNVYNSESKKAGFEETQAFILHDRSVFMEICQQWQCDSCDLQMVKLKRKTQMNFVAI